MNLPRKPFEPLPPRDGELRRVRRRALLRRARVPGSGAAVVLIAVLAYSAAGATQQAADRLEVTEAPTVEPSRSPSSGPRPSGSPGTPGLPTSPQPGPSPSSTGRPATPRPSQDASAPDRPAAPSPSPAAATHISGVVRNDASQPMRGVLVHAEPADGWGDGGLNVRLVTRTDANGRWTLPCGTRRVVLSSFEFYRATSTSAGAYHYPVGPAPACGGSLTTRLGPGGAIAGRLVDERGEPVRGSRAVDLLCPEDPSTSCLLLRTDAEGRYAFHGLRAGTYTVGAPGAKPATVQVRHGATTTYDPVVSETGSPSPSPRPSGG